MKTTFLLMFSILVTIQSMVGQTDKFKLTDSEIKMCITPIKSLNKYLHIDTSLKFIHKSDLFDFQKPHRFDPDQDKLLNDNTKFRNVSEHFALVEENPVYPGSSRFYGNLFGIKPDTSGRFIKIPDSSDKYYLIIKDPIRHTITR
jgi:hypothetical protein